MTRIGTKDHNAARLSLARLIRSFHRGELKEDKFRALIYGMNCLLGYFKLAADIRIEDRLDAIEDQLSEKR